MRLFPFIKSYFNDFLKTFSIRHLHKRIILFCVRYIITLVIFVKILHLYAYHLPLHVDTGIKLIFKEFSRFVFSRPVLVDSDA